MKIISKRKELKKQVERLNERMFALELENAKLKETSKFKYKATAECISCLNCIAQREINGTYYYCKLNKDCKNREEFEISKREIEEMLKKTKEAISKTNTRTPGKTAILYSSKMILKSILKGNKEFEEMLNKCTTEETV